MSDEQHIDDFIKILKVSPYSNEGRTASKALIAIGEPAVPSLLSEFEKYDRSSGEIMALIQTLGEIGSAQAITSLRRLLDQTEPGPLESMNLYWCISNALGSCGDQSVFPSLIDALCGAGHIERGGAYSALTTLGSEVVPNLLEVLADPEPWTRQHRQLHHPQHVADAEIIDKSGFTLRCSIIQILGEIKDRHAVPVLLDLLNAPDSGFDGRALRDTVIDSLRKFGGEPAIPYFVRELDSSNVWSRIEAAEALNRLDVARQQPEIIQKEIIALSGAVKDEFVNTRIIAAKILAEIDDPQVVPLLKDMLSDSDEIPGHSRRQPNRVCDWVAELLVIIGSPEALAAVEIWRKQQRDTPA